MADNKKSNEGPKTVPLKKTTSIPLKKETVRVSLKSDPAMPPATGAVAPAPMPLRTAPMNEPPRPAILKTDSLAKPTPLKTMPMKAAPTPNVETTTIGSKSSKPEPLKTTPLPAAPKPSPLKTQPLQSKPSPLKTTPLPAAPRPSALKTQSLQSKPTPLANKATATAPTALKTQAMNTPPKPNLVSSGTALKSPSIATSPVPVPTGLVTQPVTTGVQPAKPGIPSNPTPTVSISSPAAPGAGNPDSTIALSNVKEYEDEEANNKNAGWPFAAVALFVALVALGANIMGYLEWNQ